MRTLPEEREVHISFYESDEKAQVYTSSYHYMCKLDKLVANNPDTWKCIKEEHNGDDITSKTYECPKGMISFRSKKTTRVLTEEEKRLLAERLAKTREDAKR